MRFFRIITGGLWPIKNFTLNRVIIANKSGFSSFVKYYRFMPSSELEDLLRSQATYETNSKPKKRRGRAILISIGVIIMLILAAAGIAYAFLQKSYDEVEKVAFHSPKEQQEVLPRPAESTTEAVNILLLGSDSRATTDPDQPGEEMTGFRSDAIMVAQISPDREHVTVMSIMRDNWVEIAGFGEAKINAAFSYGGVPLAVNTIENFIGARIDHGAIVDFESFKGLTDALGGVTVKNDIAFNASHKRGHVFEAGEITLDGADALAFVRERYAFIDGDYQRVRNQQAYIKGLMSKLLSRDTLTDPQKIGATFEAIKPYLIVDEELGLPTVLSLGAQLRDIRMSDFTFFTSPTNGIGTSADGQSIVLPNFDELQVIQEHFAAGTLHEYSPVAEY